MRNIFKLIESWIAVQAKRLEDELAAIQYQKQLEVLYIEAGKPIEELSWNYPVGASVAFTIFEQWCEGLLTECQPDANRLKEYAAYTASPERYRNWLDDVIRAERKTSNPDQK